MVKIEANFWLLRDGTWLSHSLQGSTEVCPGPGLDSWQCIPGNREWYFPLRKQRKIGVFRMLKVNQRMKCWQ